MTIPVTGRVADVRLQFFSNTGAPGGQVAEFQVFGTPAPNPDLVVTSVDWTPAVAERDAAPITLSATVQNTGSAAAGATSVNFILGGTVVGTADRRRSRRRRLAPPSPSTPAPAPQGSYTVAAVVDPTNTVVEQNDTNNTFTAPTQLVVAQAPGPDLQVTGITSNPPNPAVGAAVSFTVAVNNRGTVGRRRQHHPS